MIARVLPVQHRRFTTERIKRQQPAGGPSVLEWLHSSHHCSRNRAVQQQLNSSLIQIQSSTWEH